MIVTTSEKPDAALIGYANELAAELGCAFVMRGRESLAGLRRRREDAEDGILVTGPGGLKFVSEDASPLFYHPSMALIRIKRLREGGADALITASGASAGDQVLDCTAGLGADSLVFAYAVGESGRVTAVEASPILHLIVREGFQHYETGLEEADAAMRRVRAIRADHLDTLRVMPDRSVDIVFFDPMFSQPVLTSASIRPLRAYAQDEALRAEAVREARRVASKRVVLKEHKDSDQFDLHGFRRVRSSYSTLDYGVINLL